MRYLGGLALFLIFTLVCQAGADTWDELSPTGGPPIGRESHTAVYNPTSNRMVVFGGVTFIGFTAFLNDVWVLENANGLGGTPNWTQLSPTGGPPSARTSHTAVYDPTTNRMTVFGGIDASSNFLNDVWVLENANGLGGTPNWTQLSPTGGPPSARAAHPAVYDQANNRMIVFGGQGESGLLNDVWVLSIGVGGCTEGEPCDDGNLCTINDTCVGGVCVGQTIICDDSNACTADSCDPATGCVFTPISCDDGNPCTIDSCNPATGCVNVFDPECEHTIPGGCSDGVDNDGDGATDCEDSDCAGDPACVTPPTIPALTPLGTIAMTLFLTLYGIRMLRRATS